MQADAKGLESSGVCALWTMCMCVFAYSTYVCVCVCTCVPWYISAFQEVMDANVSLLLWVPTLECSLQVSVL